LRMQVKVLSGSVKLKIGGPTIYLGNSDTWSKTVTLNADPNKWQVVNFSLNHDLSRNFRRSSYSTEAQRIYYNRWAQEPCFLVMEKGTSGTFLVDNIELLAVGEGKTFPEFKNADINKVKTLCNFNNPGQMKTLSTVLIANDQISAFELSWTRAKRTHYLPTLFERKVESDISYLHTSAEYLEEITACPIHCEGADNGNALHYKLRANKPGSKETVAGYDWNLPLEFVVFLGPREFDWKPFAATETMRKSPGPGFDYNISYKSIARQSGFSFAMYHARRFVKMDEWGDIVIPFADFTCVYGHGTYKDHLLQHKSLETGKDIMGLTVIGTFPRSGRGKTSIDIQYINQVTVPGTTQELRSYWQLPKPQEYEMKREKGHGGLGTMHKK
jgi:hypothetical protein